MQASVTKEWRRSTVEKKVGSIFLKKFSKTLSSVGTKNLPAFEELGHQSLEFCSWKCIHNKTLTVRVMGIVKKLSFYQQVYKELDNREEYFHTELTNEVVKRSVFLEKFLFMSKESHERTGTSRWSAHLCSVCCAQNIMCVCLRCCISEHVLVLRSKRWAVKRVLLEYHEMHGKTKRATKHQNMNTLVSWMSRLKQRHQAICDDSWKSSKTLISSN